MAQIVGLVQDCSTCISGALAMELLQSCAKPSIYAFINWMYVGSLMDGVLFHYSDVIMGVIASQITNLTIVNSTAYSDADQRKHQSSASLAFVRGIHRGPVNSPHKWPLTRITSSCWCQTFALVMSTSKDGAVQIVVVFCQMIHIMVTVTTNWKTSDLNAPVIQMSPPKKIS